MEAIRFPELGKAMALRKYDYHSFLDDYARILLVS